MRLALLIVFILNSALSYSQQAEFKFKDKTHRFGKVKEGEVIQTTFYFTNNGDAPLIINTYEVACECTNVVFPKEPILPGENAEIKVVFDTKGKIGYQDRSVFLISNSKNKRDKIRFTVIVKNE
jgi:hypothetical protein